MITFDQSIGWRVLEERLAATESPRQRKLIETVIAHAKAEAEFDLDGLMKTLVAEPEYHFWRDGRDVGPKGYEGVRNYYKDFVASGAAVLTSRKDRIVVDDHSITHEGIISTLGTGKIAKARGYNNIDDENAHYLMRARTNILWSFDEDGLAYGEGLLGSTWPQGTGVLSMLVAPERLGLLLAAPDDVALRADVTAELRALYGEDAGVPDALLVRRWGTDPWTLGYVTHWRPGDVMAVGPLHGTHAPPFYVCGSDQWVAGYMEGAVRTGRAAAAAALDGRATTAGVAASVRP